MRCIRKFVHMSFAISILIFLTLGGARGQTVADEISTLQARNEVGGVLANSPTCSPAPCVIPPIALATDFFHDSPIVANPVNPKQILTGGVDANCPQEHALGFFRTDNGGTDWQHMCLGLLHIGNTVYDPVGDPMVGFDGLGAAYAGGSYIIEDDFSSATVIALERSEDGGRTWHASAPALGRPNTNATQAWLTTDTNASSPYFNNVYISAVLIGPLDQNNKNEVVVSHSNDFGKTWRQVPVAGIQTSPYKDWLTHVAVGRDGNVYVTWMYCNNDLQACIFDKGTMLFAKSSDGGNTWSKPSVITNVHVTYPLPNTEVRVYDTPVLAVDNSYGPHAGNLYVTMYTWTGTYMRVGVIRSTDGGNTWSKPVPVAPPSANHDQFFPWLSVSPTGLVAVSWLDRRNDPANVKYQAFAAISRDGGQTFGPNVQLTTAFSDPNVGGELWMGDYAGNTWAGPNNFVAAWMDSSNGLYMTNVVGGIRLK